MAKISQVQSVIKINPLILALAAQRAQAVINNLAEDFKHFTSSIDEASKRMDDLKKSGAKFDKGITRDLDLWETKTLESRRMHAKEICSQLEERKIYTESDPHFLNRTFTQLTHCVICPEEIGFTRVGVYYRLTQADKVHV